MSVGRCKTQVFVEKIAEIFLAPVGRGRGPSGVAQRSGMGRCGGLGLTQRCVFAAITVVFEV